MGRTRTYLATAINQTMDSRGLSADPQLGGDGCSYSSVVRKAEAIHPFASYDTRDDDKPHLEQLPLGIRIEPVA